MRLAAPLAVAALVVLSGCSAASSGPSGTYRFVNATAEGQVIPAAQRKPAGEVRGSLMSGGDWQLSDHLGHVVLVNFWASWCAPCRVESPMLDHEYRKLHPTGVDFVGIDVKDEKQAAQAFITDFGMTYPMIYDEPAKTALQLGIPTGGLPVTVVIDRRGRVAGVYLGQVHEPSVDRVLRGLAAERVR